jgi:hypothetical protein
MEAFHEGNILWLFVHGGGFFVEWGGRGECSGVRQMRAPHEFSRNEAAGQCWFGSGRRKVGEI